MQISTMMQYYCTASGLQKLRSLTILSDDGIVEYWEHLHMTTPRMCRHLSKYIFQEL